MKITDVQACVIGRNEAHSGGCVWTFVRVYTDEGIVGTGECNSAVGVVRLRGEAGHLHDEALPDRPGPDEPRAVWEMLRRRGRYGGTTHAPLIFALTGIENALYRHHRQGAGRAGLQAAGRQVPRQDPPLCRPARRRRGDARGLRRKGGRGRRRGGLQRGQV